MKKELILDSKVTINELNYSQCLWLNLVRRTAVTE